MLRDVFGFHELAIEDAMAASHHPKLEVYDGYLYAILHGIDFKAAEHEFATHDVDFFVGAELPRDRHRRHVADRSRETQAACQRNPRLLAEGPLALMHRIVDTMVDHYRPEIDKLEERIDELEEPVFDASETRATNQEILELKRDVASLRRVDPAAAGRAEPARPPGVPADRRGGRLPLPRRLRSRRADRRRRAAVPRSADGACSKRTCRTCRTA